MSMSCGAIARAQGTFDEWLGHFNSVMPARRRYSAPVGLLRPWAEARMRSATCGSTKVWTRGPPPGAGYAGSRKAGIPQGWPAAFDGDELNDLEFPDDREFEPQDGG
jgi:hypothetical protein